MKDSTNNTVIKYDNVSYYYKTYNDDGSVGRVVGVENATLEIEKGSFVALVGHNGCGKSTLAKLTNGLLVPSKGAVTVNGLDTSEKENIFEIRKHVGLEGYEVFRMTEPEIQDEIDYMLDSIYYDEETGKVMQSVTLPGGDVDQVEL